MSKIIGGVNSIDAKLDGQKLVKGIFQGMLETGLATVLSKGAILFGDTADMKKATKARYYITQYGSEINTSDVYAEAKAGTVVNDDVVVDEYEIDLVEKSIKNRIIDSQSWARLNAEQITNIVINESKDVFVNNRDKDYFLVMYNGLSLHYNGGVVFDRTITANTDAIITVSDVDWQDSLKEDDNRAKIDLLIQRLRSTQNIKNLGYVPKDKMFLVVDARGEDIIRNSLAFKVSGGDLPAKAFTNGAEFLGKYNGVDVYTSSRIEKAIVSVYGVTPAPFYMDGDGIHFDKIPGTRFYTLGLDTKRGAGSALPEYIYGIMATPTTTLTNVKTGKEVKSFGSLSLGAPEAKTKVDVKTKVEAKTDTAK